MRQYQSFDPNAELIGVTAQGLVTSILHDDIADILERRGLSKIDPQQWYRVQQLLDVFNDVAKGGDASSMFVSIGMAAAEIGFDNMPAERKVMPISTFFSNYDAIWQSRHRNGDVGHVKYEQLSDDHIVLTVRSPYPDDMFYGAFYTYTRHFCPADRQFTVSYDPKITAQDQGGQETVIHIMLRK